MAGAGALKRSRTPFSSHNTQTWAISALTDAESATAQNGGY